MHASPEASDARVGDEYPGNAGARGPAAHAGAHVSAVLQPGHRGHAHAGGVRRASEHARVRSARADVRARAVRSGATRLPPP